MKRQHINTVLQSCRELEEPGHHQTVLDLIHYNSRGSCCPLSNHEFAESVAVDIYDAIRLYSGCTIELECYTPPYDPPLSADAARSGGFMVLHLHSDMLPYACVGIEFGRVDTNGTPLRHGLNCGEWNLDPTNPHSASVHAANFDEAWRIVCQLALMLPAAGIVISYGD